ncbi:MAG TPA: hypothetical protein ENI93_05595 [Gammaproteobacteria bacterium]|nr:hypothetical protein [Gammaproteobacteria bacterium]
MSRHRRGEVGSVPYCRTGRFFYIHQQWYFACREGRDQGPFATKAEAEAALARHIAACNGESPSRDDGQYSPNPA